MVNIFLKCICLKVNAIVRLEFELAYYDVAVQLVSRYVMGIPHQNGKKNNCRDASSDQLRLIHINVFGHDHKAETWRETIWVQTWMWLFVFHRVIFFSVNKIKFPTEFCGAFIYAEWYLESITHSTIDIPV